jgi:hypothetical protein
MPSPPPPTGLPDHRSTDTAQAHVKPRDSRICQQGLQTSAPQAPSRHPRPKTCRDRLRCSLPGHPMPGLYSNSSCHDQQLCMFGPSRRRLACHAAKPPSSDFHERFLPTMVLTQHNPKTEQAQADPGAHSQALNATVHNTSSCHNRQIAKCSCSSSQGRHNVYPPPSPTPSHPSQWYRHCSWK